MQTTLPSYIVNVLPGGKYHAMALSMAKDPTAVLENKVYGREWADASLYVLQFNNDGEYRIKPKMQNLGYRVSLHQDKYGSFFTGMAITAKDEIEFENIVGFVHWITARVQVDLTANQKAVLSTS